jgi:HlyD family secretion protein
MLNIIQIMKKIRFILRSLSRFFFGSPFLLLSIVACKPEAPKFDAVGTYEAKEVIVSSEVAGRILTFDVKEGDALAIGKVIATIDPLSIELQKEQITATMTAIGEKSNDATPQVAVLTEQINAQRQQIAVQKQQLSVLQKEQHRFEALVKADAATPKQLDDITGQISVVNRQIEAAESQIKVVERQIQTQKDVVALQNKGISSEKLPLEKRLKQLDDQIARTRVVNPLAGVVLTKYAEVGEITTAGKPLYKVADMTEMTLRAYVQGSQLGQIKLGQKVRIRLDDGADKSREVVGTINWIASKAEFTPKTIQTKDERANLVYAVKIGSVNDGSLKIGMYGEVIF